MDDLIRLVRRRLAGDYVLEKNSDGTYTVAAAVLAVFVANADQLNLYREGYQPEDDDE